MAEAGSDSTVNTSRDLPDAFNHKEVGYPVTETQHRAKSPPCTRRPLLLILSFPLFVPDAKYKVKGEAERKERKEGFGNSFLKNTARSSLVCCVGGFTSSPHSIQQLDPQTSCFRLDDGADGRCRSGSTGRPRDTELTHPDEQVETKH